MSSLLLSWVLQPSMGHQAYLFPGSILTRAGSLSAATASVCWEVDLMCTLSSMSRIINSKLVITLNVNFSAICNIGKIV